MAMALFSMMRCHQVNTHTQTHTNTHTNTCTHTDTKTNTHTHTLRWAVRRANLAVLVVVVNKVKRRRDRGGEKGFG